MKEGDAIVCFLTMVRDVVAHGIDVFFRKLCVMNFCFLQPNEVGLILVADRLKLVDAYPNTVDVK